MRTMLDLPEGLVEEACKLLGLKSKSEAVVLSLKELLRRRRIEDLKSLMGKVNLEIDLPASRRRP
ncbi:MAG TPA: type II toxin-antitoxin system VapB family antitoxin [Terriglobales bacterium]|nr:type II toxin-antitoxin system VapB family antitoxin [Terriglobales bacterium]